MSTSERSCKRKRARTRAVATVVHAVAAAITIEGVVHAVGTVVSALRATGRAALLHLTSSMCPSARIEVMYAMLGQPSMESLVGAAAEPEGENELVVREWPDTPALPPGIDVLGVERALVDVLMWREGDEVPAHLEEFGLTHDPITGAREPARACVCQ